MSNVNNNSLGITQENIQLKQWDIQADVNRYSLHLTVHCAREVRKRAEPLARDQFA